MSWLWVGAPGPHPIPDWAETCLAGKPKVNCGMWLCVEQMSYLGDTPVRLIRIFDPAMVPPGAEINEFGSLDRHQELILYDSTSTVAHRFGWEM